VKLRQYWLETSTVGHLEIKCCELEGSIINEVGVADVDTEKYHEEKNIPIVLQSFYP
jgi:hypothetical protein